MEDNRHPITEAGIGALIDTVARRWAAELSSDESVIVFDSDMTIGPRHCQLIQSIHTRRQPDFLVDKVRLFIDSELNLPIRLKATTGPGNQVLPPDLRRNTRTSTSNSTSATLATSILMSAIASIPSVVSATARCSYRSIRLAHSLVPARSLQYIRRLPRANPHDSSGRCRYLGNEGNEVPDRSFPTHVPCNLVHRRRRGQAGRSREMAVEATLAG